MSNPEYYGLAPGTDLFLGFTLEPQQQAVLVLSVPCPGLALTFLFVFMSKLWELWSLQGLALAQSTQTGREGG